MSPWIGNIINHWCKYFRSHRIDLYITFSWTNKERAGRKNRASIDLQKSRSDNCEKQWIAHWSWGQLYWIIEVSTIQCFYHVMHIFYMHSIRHLTLNTNACDYPWTHSEYCVVLKWWIWIDSHHIDQPHHKK